MYKGHQITYLLSVQLGCGKTEIARRIAKLSEAPFIKVEATKFTEVGFHGKDVDQIIRDLVDVAINMTKKKIKEVMKYRSYRHNYPSILAIIMYNVFILLTSYYNFILLSFKFCHCSPEELKLLQQFRKDY